jgi:hypothetical protein
VIKKKEMKGVASDTSEDRDYSFDVLAESRRYFFVADDEPSMQEWVLAIHSVIASP